MPTLIVKPIDMSAPGSYAARRKIRRARAEYGAAMSRIEQLQAQAQALQTAAEGGHLESSPVADAMQSEITVLLGKVMNSMLELEDLTIAQARTDDGSPIADVLAIISGDDFNVLLRAMMGESPVPPVSSGS